MKILPINNINYTVNQKRTNIKSSQVRFQGTNARILKGACIGAAPLFFSTATSNSGSLTEVLLCPFLICGGALLGCLYDSYKKDKENIENESFYFGHGSEYTEM